MVALLLADWRNAMLLLLLLLLLMSINIADNVANMTLDESWWLLSLLFTVSLLC